jgi:NAD(P)H dehydrogenase (quinone)
MILITGAAGHLGTAVIEQLLTSVPPHEIIALVRSESKGAKWKDKGIAVRIGDYKDKESLEKAFQGVQQLLLIPTNEENVLNQHKQVIDTAKQVGVKHFFYASGALNQNVASSKLGPLVDAYITTENYIKESGLHYTIFQNCLYAETIPFFIGENPFENGIYFPSGDGKASFAKRAEMGEAIANVMAKGPLENATYLLTGRRSYSFAEIAQILAKLSGTNVSFISPDPSAFERTLKEYGVNDQDIWFASLFAEIIKNEEYDVCDSTLERLLRRIPTSLEDYLAEVYITDAK